ncbi:MAG: hypothetical protein R2751_09190 [Bacteroidales bacterium]
MENKEHNAFSFSSVDLLIYLWQKRLVLILVGLVAGITSIVVSLLITPMFQSSVIMFPASNAAISKELLSKNYSGRESAYAFGAEEQAEQLLQVLHSEPIRSRIIGKYNLMEHYEISPDDKYPYTRLHEQYTNNIKYRLTEFMSVEISVMDRDPVVAAGIANDICDLVDTVYNEMRKERAHEAYRLVNQAYTEAEHSLALLDDTLARVGAAVKDRFQTPGLRESDKLARVLAESAPAYVSTLILWLNESQIVADLSQRLNEARLEVEQNLPYKFVVERAHPSEKKAYPNKSLIVIVTTFASLLFALIVLIVRDNIRDRLAQRKET